MQQSSKNSAPNIKKRVLLFTSAYSPLTGGSEIAIKEIANRLSEIHFDIVTPRYSLSHSNYEEIGNTSIYRVGLGTLLSKWAFPVLGCIKGLILSYKYKYIRIHVFQASYAGGVVWLMSIFRPSIKFVLTMQEGKDLKKQSLFVRFFRGLIIKRAEKITVISSFLNEYVMGIKNNADIVVIPNGVNINMKDRNEEISRKEILSKFPNAEEDSKILITSSRLVEKNGIGDLVTALSFLDDKFVLLIAGSGNLENEIKKNINKLNLNNRIVFLGDVPNEKIYGYLHSSDIFIRPSLSEGLGISFLEAMLMEVPIIATMVGGIVDFLKDGETGYVCKPNDPKSISEAVIRASNDKKINTVIHNAKKLVQEKYDWDNISKKYEEIIYNNPSL